MRLSQHTRTCGSHRHLSDWPRLSFHHTETSHSKVQRTRNTVSIWQKSNGESLRGSPVFTQTGRQNHTQNEEFQIQVLATFSRLGNIGSCFWWEPEHGLHGCLLLLSYCLHQERASLHSPSYSQAQDAPVSASEG